MAKALVSGCLSLCVWQCMLCILRIFVACCMILKATLSNQWQTNGPTDHKVYDLLVHWFANFVCLSVTTNLKGIFFNFFTLLNIKEYSGRWRPLIQRSFWKFQSVCLSDLLWRCQNMRLGSNDLVIVIAGSIFEVSRWAQLLKKFLCLKILHFAEWTILEFYMFLSV